MRRLLRRAALAAAAPAGVALRYTVQAFPGLLGLFLVSFGAWMAYRPAGFMVAGLLVLADVVQSRRPVPVKGGR